MCVLTFVEMEIIPHKIDYQPTAKCEKFIGKHYYLR